MPYENTSAAGSGAPPRGPYPAARLVRLPLIIALMAALLFPPAGRLDWYPAWALILADLAFLAVYGVGALRRDPVQVAGRSRAAASVERVW